eukprot:scaffold21266_cov99-Phaeocystis_antarctica.AAC.1
MAHSASSEHGDGAKPTQEIVTAQEDLIERARRKLTPKIEPRADCCKLLAFDGASEKLEHKDVVLIAQPETDSAATRETMGDASIAQHALAPHRSSNATEQSRRRDSDCTRAALQREKRLTPA